jgi:hypothetical protein
VTAATRANSPLRGHALSAAERKRAIEAARRERPFLAWRAGDGALRIEILDDERPRTIGRRPGMDVVVDDPRVSGLHARLECHGREWSIVDDGLSRNGTFVNGSAVVTRARLADTDLIRVGDTLVAFSAPRGPAFDPTVPADDHAPIRTLTPQQRSVLVALCRPLLRDDAPGRLPASNDEIAAELHLSVGAVKMHLRSLFAKFGVEHLRQNEKRLRLATEAIDGGVVSRRDAAGGAR